MQLITSKTIRRKVLAMGRRALLRGHGLLSMADAIPLHYAADEATRGRALLSYRPSLTLRDKSHTGIIECQVMAEVLCQLGFDVDAYSSSDNVNSVTGDSYNLIIGFGHPFRQAAQSKNASTITVLYCTEGPPLLAMQNEQTAIARITEKSGLAPAVIRHSELYLEDDMSLANNLLVLGDDTDRWMHSDKPVHYLYPTGFRPVLESAWIQSKQPNKELMWIGSSGVANKGLDLAFEIAGECEATLHVLGIQQTRERAILSELALRSPSVIIEDHGFLQYGGSEFTALLKQVAACLLPSASEAAPTGCLTACRNGVPAFVLSNCGIVRQVGGMTPCIDAPQMVKDIQNVLQLSIADYRALALRTYADANNIFSIQHFREKFRQCILNILAD